MACWGPADLASASTEGSGLRMYRPYLDTTMRYLFADDLLCSQHPTIRKRIYKTKYYIHLRQPRLKVSTKA